MVYEFSNCKDKINDVKEVIVESKVQFEMKFNVSLRDIKIYERCGNNDRKIPLIINKIAKLKIRVHVRFHEWRTTVTVCSNEFKFLKSFLKRKSAPVQAHLEGEDSPKRNKTAKTRKVVQKEKSSIEASEEKLQEIKTELTKSKAEIEDLKKQFPQYKEQVNAKIENKLKQFSNLLKKNEALQAYSTGEV